MDWIKLKSKVKTKLVASGATLTVTTLDKGGYDIAAGTKAEYETEYSVSGLITDYTEKDIANGLAQVGDKKVLLPTSDLPDLTLIDSFKIVIGVDEKESYILAEDGSFILDEDDNIIIGATEERSLVLNPIRVQMISPGNVGLMYKIQARG